MFSPASCVSEPSRNKQTQSQPVFSSKKGRCFRNPELFPPLRFLKIGGATDRSRICVLGESKNPLGRLWRFPVVPGAAWRACPAHANGHCPGTRTTSRNHEKRTHDDEKRTASRDSKARCFVEKRLHRLHRLHRRVQGREHALEILEGIKESVRVSKGSVVPFGAPVLLRAGLPPPAAPPAPGPRLRRGPQDGLRPLWVSIQRV